MTGRRQAVRVSSAAVLESAPAEIDLDTFQPCRRHLLKALFVKNVTFEPLVMLVKFLPETSWCPKTPNTPLVALPM